MRKLSAEKRAAILTALVEGNSVNATARITGASKITVLRLLADAGTLCAELHDAHVRNLATKRVQVDEVWSFVGCKQRTKERGGKGEGDSWVWAALDADSKLCIDHHVGAREVDDAHAFMGKVAKRLAGRVQLTSDGLSAYWHAVVVAFDCEVDFAMLVKEFQNVYPGAGRYSPPAVIRITKKPRIGKPEEAHISTSFVERQNLTMRMGMRRFTRLTNGFSKRLENHKHAIALHYWHYNFARKHMTIKTMPAVAAGIADRALTMLDLAQMLEAAEAKAGGRLTGYLPAESSK